MVRIRLLSLAVALFLIPISSLQNSISAPIITGKTCSKKDQIKSFKAESFKCTLKKGKLTWQPRSNAQVAPSSSATPSTSPSPVPTPSQTPIPELPNIGLNLLKADSSHYFAAEVGDLISDSIQMSTDVRIVELSAHISNLAGTKLVSGVVTLDSYVAKISTWKIQFSTGESLVVGNYTKNLEAKTVDGRVLSFLNSPLEIKPKSRAGALRKSKATCSEEKGDCMKLSDPALLLPVRSCMINDSSVASFSQGFPRPALAKVGSRVTRVLWMPVGFTDLPLTDDFAAISESYFIEYKNFFLEQSYGRSKFEFVIPDRRNWISINQTWTSFKEANSGDLQGMTQNLLDRISAPDPSKFDAVFLITPPSKVIQSGGMTRPTFQTDRFGPVTGVYLVVGGDLKSVTHSMGHNIFYLEDLYIHDFYMKPGRDKWPMQNEIMGGGGPLSGWQRWLNGWLDDSDIRCSQLTTQESIHALKPLESLSGTRLLVIPTSSHSAWIAEVRNSDGPEGNGLFIYSLDTNFEHGNGPMANVRGTLPIGGSWSGSGIKITIIGQSEERIYLSLSKS